MELNYLKTILFTKLLSGLTKSGGGRIEAVDLL